MAVATQERALEIDGIRGWASFVVLLYHTFHEMFTRLLPWINSAWIAPLFEGRLAVCVFFVLSGDALTTAFFSRGALDDSPVARLVVRRYTRLTIPILMSCTLVFVLHLAHVDWHMRANEVVDRPDWLGKMIAFPFSLVDVLRYSLLGVYTSYNKATSYNPFLWTMSIEMIGSLLIFTVCFLWPRLRNGKLLLAGIAGGLFLLNSFLCLFFAGMLFGLLRNESFYTKRCAQGRFQTAWLVGFVSLILLRVAAYGHQMPLLFDLVVAMALVFLIYAHRGLRALMRNRVSTWVGDVSFPLYLVQFAVIISFESWAVVEWKARAGGTGWLPLIGAAAVGVTLGAAWLFRQAERRILQRVDRWVLRILSAD